MYTYIYMYICTYIFVCIYKYIYTYMRQIGPSIFVAPINSCSVQTHVAKRCFARICSLQTRRCSPALSAPEGPGLDRSVHLFSWYRLIIARYKHILSSHF